ncbi:hypothetical protein ACFLY8_01020 [Halobacteriota archaeon]
MLDEKEKIIRALELEHQELMTFTHTFSWMIFTFLVALFVISVSLLSDEVLIFCLLLILLLVMSCITWYKICGKLANRAKEIRNQILEL